MQLFLRVLTLCHSIVPSGQLDVQTLIYRTASPDELALAEWARSQGRVFLRRTTTQLFVMEEQREVSLNHLLQLYCSTSLATVCAFSF